MHERITNVEDGIEAAPDGLAVTSLAGVEARHAGAGGEEDGEGEGVGEESRPEVGGEEGEGEEGMGGE